MLQWKRFGATDRVLIEGKSKFAITDCAKALIQIALEPFKRTEGDAKDPLLWPESLFEVCGIYEASSAALKCAGSTMNMADTGTWIISTTQIDSSRPVSVSARSRLAAPQVSGSEI